MASRTTIVKLGETGGDMKNTIFDLTGRVALVTGGSKGIGHAIARGLARAGAELFICSRNQDSLRTAAEAIRQEADVRVEYAAADMGQPDELAGPALLLASEAGSYITGTCLIVDGGALSRVF